MFPIATPTLLLNAEICKANIARMMNRAKKHHVQLVPHFKTHQSGRVGEWFREVGVTSITVTSVKMAKYFARHSWSDITIAFPVNVLEVEELNGLAANNDLKIFVNSVETAAVLKEQFEFSVGYYIEIDTGDGRSGVEAGDFTEISKIIGKTANSNLNFFGFYTHPGHTYHATSPEEVLMISEEVRQKLKALKCHFREEFPDLKIAMGDTPSCSVSGNFEEIDSIHPGNFVYYDLVQHSIGVNTIEEIAICLAVPVVAVHLERQEVIVHSGWVHQGKDALRDSEGNLHYGLVVEVSPGGWSEPIPGARVSKLSQEHGVVSLPEKIINRLKIGDVFGILPVHACATAVMMGEARTLEGERIEMMQRF